MQSQKVVLTGCLQGVSPNTAPTALELRKRARLRKAPSLLPTTLNVGLAQRTKKLFRATRVQSILTRQTAKISVT
jgi:hypothetical protein